MLILNETDLNNGHVMLDVESTQEELDILIYAGLKHLASEMPGNKLVVKRADVLKDLGIDNVKKYELSDEEAQELYSIGLTAILEHSIAKYEKEGIPECPKEQTD